MIFRGSGSETKISVHVQLMRPCIVLAKMHPALMSFYCLPRLRTWSHLAWSIRSPTNSPSPLHSKSLPTSKSWPRTPPGTERKPSLSHAGEEERNGKRGEAGKGGKEEYEIYMRRGEGGKGGEVRRECERHEKRGGREGRGGKEGV